MNHGKPTSVARSRVLALGLAAVVLGACGRNRYVPPPPPEVTVSQPVAQEITTYNEFTGYTAAVEAVDIRARVQGYLQSVNFKPGENVKKGDLLFIIEPSLYQARVDQAQADVEGKDAQYRAAQAQLEITEAIVKGSAGSRTDLVQKTQARDLAKAQLAMAQANLASRQARPLLHAHLRADRRAHRSQLRRRRQSRRQRPGDAARLDRLRRSDLRVLHRERAPAPAGPGATAAGAHGRTRGSGQRGLTKVWMEELPRPRHRDGLPARREGRLHGQQGRSGYRHDRGASRVPEPESRDPRRTLRPRARALHARAGGARTRRRRAGGPGRFLPACSSTHRTPSSTAASTSDRSRKAICG